MNGDKLEKRLAAGADETAQAIREFITGNAARIAALAGLTAESVNKGGKVLVFGNGGSAADAQHLAAELVGRFAFDRPPVPALALSVNTSVLTCVGNDYGFEDVFARQVAAHGRAGDVAIGISTSGKSPNVLKAMKVAKDGGLHVVGLAGEYGGDFAPLCQSLFCAPTQKTPRVQECHIAWIHAYTMLVEEMLFGKGPDGP